MKKRFLKNVVVSVRNRLLTIARQRDKPFHEVLILYGLERFLYRLSQSVHKDKFVLKGGLLLIGFGFPQARPTRDIDLLGLLVNDVDTISKIIQEIGSMNINDGLDFDFSKISYEIMSPDSEYPGLRFKFVGHLGQARIPMQIDIGFGDHVVPDPKEIEFPTLLEMEPPIILSYSLQTVIAEKFEAALDLADLNSRMKDFYDIWLLSQRYSFNGEIIQKAVTATCRRRKTTIRSNSEMFTDDFAKRPDKQIQWTAFVKKGTFTEVPGKFAHLMTDIRTFLLPIAKSCETKEPFKYLWPTGGPWSDQKIQIK